MLWNGSTVEKRSKHTIHIDEVVDDISYALFGVRRWSCPLVLADGGDQITHGSAHTREILDGNCCHPRRLWTAPATLATDLLPPPSR